MDEKQQVLYELLFLTHRKEKLNYKLMSAVSFRLHFKTFV